MAEAGLGYYRSQQGLSSAQKAVEGAEARLAAARGRGDPALVAQAEAELRQARRGVESAAMGTLAAGESLIGTAQSVASDRANRPFEDAVRRARSLLVEAKATADRLDETLVSTVDLPEPLARRLREDKKRLEEAGAQFEEDLRQANGDPEKEAVASRREIELSHERLEALKGVDQDFKKIEEDIKRSQFQLGDPSTWLGTKTDEAKNEARDRYKDAAERYRDLLSDELSSEAERRAAAEDLLRARSDFDRVRGVVEQQAASADYLTPLSELVQLGQDAYHDESEKQRQALVDGLTDLGLPPALVGLAALPGELSEGTVDALAGLLKSPVYVADDIAGMVAHPVDTVTGLIQLGLRAEDASYSGRTFNFLVEAATGKYSSLDEAEAAFLDEMDPMSLLDAQSQLVVDLGRGALGRSIELAKEGKWTEAMSTLVGTNVDWGAVIGGLRGVRRLRAIIEAEAETQKATRAATEGTQAASEAGRLAADSAAPSSSIASGPEAKVLARSKPEHYNASIAEIQGFEEALRRGQVPILEPGAATAKGLDYATYDPRAGEIVIWDAKYRSPGGSYPSSIPATKIQAWGPQLQRAIASMADGPLKDEILAALRAGKVRGRIFRWPPQ
jgi:hypothetical protein